MKSRVLTLGLNDPDLQFAALPSLPVFDYFMALHHHFLRNFRTKLIPNVFLTLTQSFGTYLNLDLISPIGVDSEEESRLNHPFEVRDRPLPNPFMLGLTGMKGSLSSVPKNALTLSTMTPAMRDAARSHRLAEFPVSSGNAHRVKEADITLEEDIEKIPTGLLAAQQAVTSLANSDDPVLKMLKYEPSEPESKLPPLPDQLIKREPEAAENGTKEQPATEASMTEAQKLNLANPLGIIMFGGHPEPEVSSPQTPPLPPLPPSPSALGMILSLLKEALS